MNQNSLAQNCLKAMGKTFHPECFVCAYCGKIFANSPFYLEDGLPYCEEDWNELFTTKCVSCGFPIEAGDRWVEALNNNYHSQCFNCTLCKKNLEGKGFFVKAGKPFCKSHAKMRCQVRIHNTRCTYLSSQTHSQSSNLKTKKTNISRAFYGQFATRTYTHPDLPLYKKNFPFHYLFAFYFTQMGMNSTFCFSVAINYELKIAGTQMATTFYDASHYQACFLLMNKRVIKFVLLTKVELCI